MRLAAAWCVVFSHSFPLSYGASASQPFALLSHRQATLGTLAVYVFFVLSGYLITGSFGRQSPHQFVLARGLRLIPGLALVLIALACVIGPFLTTVSMQDYFSSQEPYRFIVENLSLTSYTGRLPGVFEGNPFEGEVNGSLWTLHYEAGCYLLVFALGISGLLNRYVLSGLLAIALVCSWRYIGGPPAEFGSLFLGGAALYVWKPPLRFWIAAACSAVWVASLWTGFRMVSAVFGAYVILYIGLSPSVRLPKMTRWGDLSYGTYIWAFPVQQSVSFAFGAAITWYANFLISAPIILACALFSWHFVEGPALSLKSRSRLVTAIARNP